MNDSFGMWITDSLTAESILVADLAVVLALQSRVFQQIALKMKHTNAKRL